MSGDQNRTCSALLPLLNWKTGIIFIPFFNFVGDFLIHSQESSELQREFWRHWMDWSGFGRVGGCGIWSSLHTDSHTPCNVYLQHYRIRHNVLPEGAMSAICCSQGGLHRIVLIYIRPGIVLQQLQAKLLALEFVLCVLNCVHFMLHRNISCLLIFISKFPHEKVVSDSESEIGTLQILN